MTVFDKIVLTLRRIAMLALVVMMAVTIIDVSMRMILTELVLGSVEVVQLMLVAVVFLALPETFRRNEQITVDVIDQLAGAKTVRRLRLVAAFLTMVVIVVMAWRTVPPALDTLEIGDLTSDLQISLFWYWLPLSIGVVCAAIAGVLAFIAESRGESAPREAGELPGRGDA